jgi:hypothetical protein
MAKFITVSQESARAVRKDKNAKLHGVTDRGEIIELYRKPGETILRHVIHELDQTQKTLEEDKDGEAKVTTLRVIMEYEEGEFFAVFDRFSEALSCSQLLRAEQFVLDCSLDVANALASQIDGDGNILPDRGCSMSSVLYRLMEELYG